MSHASFRYAAIGAASLAALGACTAHDALPADEVCRDVGYAMANRIFECTGDHDRANAAYDRLDSKLDCLVRSKYGKGEIGERVLQTDAGTLDVRGAYGCVSAVREVPCKTARALEKDPAAWLGSASPTCAQLFATKSGQPLPEGGGVDAGGGDDGIRYTGVEEGADLDVFCPMDTQASFNRNPATGALSGTLTCSSALVNFSAPQLEFTYSFGEVSVQSVFVSAPAGVTMDPLSSPAELATYGLVFTTFTPSADQLSLRVEGRFHGSRVDGRLTLSGTFGGSLPCAGACP